jgi:Sortase family.
MDTIGRRLRLRLLPALLTALGVALLATGLMSYTTAVEAPPVAHALASYEPLPTLAAGLNLPGGSGTVDPSFPPDRVATRLVIRRLGIDLPVMLQTGNYGIFPLCDVALYQPLFGQPGQGRATYIYAHARTGMFLPLLTASKDNNGARMLGMTVEVYTSDNWRFLYSITEVRRHTRDLNDALATTTERLWLQTSEGPYGTVPKLQVVADFLSAEKTDPASAHPNAHPRICG